MNDAEKIVHEDPGEVGLVEFHDFVSEQPFVFEQGGKIPAVTIRYETYGRLNPAKDNAILICHALSGDHHCAGIYSLQDRKPGWWNAMIGPGKPIDTSRFFVVCSNCIGGCQGSSGPSSLNPGTGQPYQLDFPLVTIADMVRAQKLLIEHLGIAELYCVIGGSMGGMQALQWAIDYPDVVRSVLGLATTARQNAQAIAFNEVGRVAITHDPAWQGGAYSAGRGPDVGLSIARMMAHITYLSDKGMDEKFGRNRRTGDATGKQFDIEFEVEGYLRYQGKSFVNRFDANSYLFLTKALDRFDLYGSGGQLEDAFSHVQSRILIVGFTSDWLFPPEQNKAIVHALLRCGKAATYAELNMDLGHDSFLIESPELFTLVSSFLG